MASEQAHQGAFAIVPVDMFDLGLKHSALIVFMALASFAGKSRIVWPSVSTVAEMVDMTERSVRRQIGELIEAGVVSRVPRYDGAGRQTSNAYRLDILVSRLSGGADSSDTPDPDPGVRGEGDSSVSQREPEGTRQEEHESEARAREQEFERLVQEQFEDWFQHYPRRVARGAAEKAFRKARKEGASFEELVAGAKRYAAWAARRGDPTYTKHPSTWLNQKCWLDEEEPAGAGADGELTWWQKERRAKQQARKAADSAAHDDE